MESFCNEASTVSGTYTLIIFYKQHFYKQHQAETGKKMNKSETKPWGWTFAIWKLFAFFIHIIIQKTKGYIPKNVWKTSVTVLKKLYDSW